MEHMEWSTERAFLLEKGESSAKNLRWQMNMDAELYEHHHGKVLNAVVGFSTTVFTWLQGNGTEPMKQMEWGAETDMDGEWGWKDGDEEMLGAGRGCRMKQGVNSKQCRTLMMYRLHYCL